jgi:hypothetical protein
MEGIGEAIGRGILVFCIICFIAGCGLGIGGYFLISWLIKHITISFM